MLKISQVWQHIWLPWKLKCNGRNWCQTREQANIPWDSGHDVSTEGAGFCKQHTMCRRSMKYKNAVQKTQWSIATRCHNCKEPDMKNDSHMWTAQTCLFEVWRTKIHEEHRIIHVGEALKQTRSSARATAVRSPPHFVSCFRMGGGLWHPPQLPCVNITFGPNGVWSLSMGWEGGSCDMPDPQNGHPADEYANHIPNPECISLSTPR